jgi:hypothetical protein
MGRHEDTLNAVFTDPLRANISWRAIIAMLQSLGADVTEGKGSRVRVVLKGVRATFHRPHPQHEANKLLVKSVRRLLQAAGIR